MASTIPILEFMPVGFRFRPTDEELVDYYLKHKLQGDEFPVHIIPDIDLCKVEPWDIPAYSVIESDDPEWFFFSPRDYKYAKSTRSNRATNHGFWKTTGQERYIKARGTNNVIGAKKTLVFYKGRVPHGVRTNWVIHEYHATTFDVSQRTSVLCRLMKKVEKKAEGVSDALAYEEGEPSNHMASDYENQAPAEGYPNVCISPPEAMNIDSIFQEPPQATSLQHSPIGTEQQESFPNSPYDNAYIRISMDIPFQTTEEEHDANEFVDSIWVDEDFVIREEREHAFISGYIRPESSRRVYRESIDTDAEVVSARYGNIVDTSTVCAEHASSRNYHVSKMVQSSHGAVHGGTHPLSSTQEAYIEKKETIFPDDFWGVETSSCDSTADNPLEINSIEIYSSPSSLRKSKNQYNPRPDNFVSQRAAARRSQRKVSSNAVSHLKDKKKLAIVESEKDQEKTQSTSSRKILETRSSDVNRNGYFIRLETPSSSQSLFPRSVYLVNVVIGILLLIVISWEVLSC